MKWLQEGDKNTKFFHLVASSRKRANHIAKLTIHDKVVDKPGDIQEAITSHFESLFNKHQATQVKDLNCNLKMLNENSATLLECPFSEVEVWDVIQHCDGNKAPGPDGFNLHFFKSQWNVVKDDVMKVLDEFFLSGMLDSRLNKSFIALILKCAMPSCLNDYRSISLVGSMYKILAKVLANRLRSVVIEVIGPNQFSFVKGKQI